MKISIVIPTLNEELYIERILSSIERQNLNQDLQIIVSDGNSEDRTKEIATRFKKHFKDFTLVESQTRGVSTQRNVGASRAKHPYILFLDADMRLPEKFLQRLITKVERTGKNDIVVLVAHIPTTKNIFDWLFVLIMMTYASIVRFFDPLCAGSFMLTTRRLHNKIRGFDESIVLAEDLDYGRRIRRAGARYYLFYSPFIYASPRRLRSFGRIRLLLQWTFGGLYTTFIGPIRCDNKFFNYKFGNHNKKL